MKRIILLGLMLVGALFCKGFAFEQAYQEYGAYYDVNTSTSLSVTVSSSAVTTSAAVFNGVERIFKIDETPTSALYFQRGGSTTTVTSNGMPLDNSVYYVEDRYFGAIYFQAGTADVKLKMTTLKKE